MDHDTVVVVCGSQMSKTEGMFNILGHRFTDGPFVPALYVGPTEKQVKSISKDRIDKMLRSTPVLWERTEKGQRYQVYEKWIAGSRLGFAWAGSATELASHPAGLVLVDERDRMDSDAGGEGDPVSLARARAKNFLSRKVGVFSTPTLEGASAIWTLWEEGTMHMWAWKCTGCLAYFVPRLDVLKWPEGCSPDQALEQAWVECPSCHAHMAGDRKPRLNQEGRYIRHRKLLDHERAEGAVWGKYVPDPDPPRLKTASFWISGLASPWVTFGEAAKVMIEAYRSGSQERIQAEINTMGGELYRVRGDAPEWEEVAGRKREYSPRQIQPGIQVLTLGADVQKYGIYWGIWGWGYMSESWMLDHGFLAGETEHEAVWRELRELIATPVSTMQIRRAFIDSGYRPGDASRRPDHAVYTFARTMPGMVYPTKGQDAMDAPYKYSNIDYSFGGQVIKGGVRLFHLNTDFFKRWLHARIRWPEGQPGGWHLHNETTEDFCKQMVAEQLVLKASGRATWVRTSRKNHYLDVAVNATAAAYSLNVHQLKPSSAAAPSPETSPTSEAPQQRSPYQRRSLF